MNWDTLLWIVGIGIFVFFLIVMMRGCGGMMGGGMGGGCGMGPKDRRRSGMNGKDMDRGHDAERRPSRGK